MEILALLFIGLLVAIYFLTRDNRRDRCIDLQLPEEISRPSQPRTSDPVAQVRPPAQPRPAAPPSIAPDPFRGSGGVIRPVEPKFRTSVPDCGPMDIFSGRCLVIDGDTIIVRKQRIRLFGIDAPEMEHPWGNKSKWTLIGLCRGKDIAIHPQGQLSHERIVAKCFLPDGRDLSEEMVRRGMALDWPEYSGGAYLQFEQEGIRARHWRADARQSGRHDIWSTPYRPKGDAAQRPVTYAARRRKD